MIDIEHDENTVDEESTDNSNKKPSMVLFIVVCLRIC